MNTTIVLGILTSLIAGEITSIGPWCAKKLARWSAFRRYEENPERAEIRAEELEALVETRPGNLLKLLTALGFAAAGLAARLYKAARRGGRDVSREAPRPLVLPQAIPQAAAPSSERFANASFSAFYQYTYPRLVRFLAYRLADVGISEDVAQEAMFEACQKWDMLRTYERPDAWVFKVATRRLRHYQERQARVELALKSADLVGQGTPDLTEMHIDVASALDFLPNRQAEVIRLHVLEGYSLAETAGMLSISVSSVGRDLRAGLGHLRQRLKSWSDTQRT